MSAVHVATANWRCVHAHMRMQHTTGVIITCVCVQRQLVAVQTEAEKLRCTTGFESGCTSTQTKRPDDDHPIDHDVIRFQHPLT